MSVNKLVSIKNAIVDAMDRLAIDHDKLIPLFTRWATLAEKAIGSKYQYVTKREVLKIDNCTACLPSDAVYIQTAILGDYGCDCADLMASICGCVGAYGGASGSFLIVDIGGGSFDGSIRGYINHTIQNNKLIFSRDMSGDSVTIQYLAVATDCDGFVEINENHIEAITEFIIWRYYSRKFGANTLEYGKANKAESEWHRLCSNARAIDAQLSDSDRQEIVYGMLHNPYIGISLSAGMHTTLDDSSL